MDRTLPTRKPLRIPSYDYAQGNGYFLTLCTEARKPLFWSDLKLTDPQFLPLSAAGRAVQTCIEQIPVRYECVKVEKYCIMPDHVHLLLFYDTAVDGRPMVAPTVSRVVQQFKGAVSKMIGMPIWQRSFYDHVIRNEADFLACWQYIDHNPLKYEV